MSTERFAAVVAWTEEVRRIGAAWAQQQETYHAVADALESLRRTHEPSVDMGAAGERMGVKEKEAAFPPAARATPSSVLSHAVYEAHISASTRSKGCRAPSTVAEETTAPAEQEPDARSAHVERMLQEARLLRATQNTGRLRATRPEPLSSRVPLDPGAVKKSHARAPAPHAQHAASRPPVTVAPGPKHGSAYEASNAVDETLDVPMAGESDALERILRQAREIAALNQVHEATADTVHAGRAQRQGLRGKGASGGQTVGVRSARAAPTAGPALPATSAQHVKPGGHAGKPLRPFNTQDRKERGLSQSKDEAAKTTEERPEAAQVTQVRHTSGSMTGAAGTNTSLAVKTPKAAAAHTPKANATMDAEVQGDGRGEPAGETGAREVGCETEAIPGSSASMTDAGHSCATREVCEQDTWHAFVAALDDGADFGPGFRPSLMRAEVVSARRRTARARRVNVALRYLGFRGQATKLTVSNTATAICSRKTSTRCLCSREHKQAIFVLSGAQQ